MDDIKVWADPSMRIIEAVADRKGVEPEDLTPLYDAIDPGALDALLTTSRDTASRPLTVRFTYEGYSVTVHDDGRVELSTVN